MANLRRAKQSAVSILKAERKFLRYVHFLNFLNDRWVSDSQRGVAEDSSLLLCGAVTLSV
jgi:hypothetical protein